MGNKDKSNKNELSVSAEETGAGAEGALISTGLPASADEPSAGLSSAGPGPGLSPGAGGGLCASPAPDPTLAGASPLDPEEGSGTAAENSPLGSDTRRRDTAEADAAKEEEALKTVGQWISEKRLAGWQSAALLRAKGWTEDKRVSAAEFELALKQLMSRGQGARSK